MSLTWMRHAIIILQFFYLFVVYGSEIASEAAEYEVWNSIPR